ncbi:MAG: hypothetical protein AB2A00_34550 [Myxococcota bacterium]
MATERTGPLPGEEEQEGEASPKSLVSERFIHALCVLRRRQAARRKVAGKTGVAPPRPTEAAILALQH